MLFSELSTYFERLEATPSRLAMTEILSELFNAASHDEIGSMCYLLQGRVAPLYDAIEFGIADKFMIRAIAKASDAEIEEVVRAFRAEGDLGSAAQKVSKKQTVNSKQQLSVQEVFEKLKEIAQTGGEGSQEKKIDMLAELLRHADPLSIRYLVRIPLGKLRLGFSDMTILDSLSWMIMGDKSLRERLETVFNVRPDIGYIAQTVKNEGIEGLKKVRSVLGAPILSALCQRLPTAEEMIEKMGEVAVEPKFDGVRVQIHYKVKSKMQKVKTFSRNLENTTEMFPELQEIGSQVNAAEVILDSEAIGVDPKTGKMLSFQETTTRKRKHGIQLALETVPLRFYVFDILYKDGDDLLLHPLRERRSILEKTIRTGKLLEISPHIVTNNPEEIRKYHETQINNGLEGVVVKKWNGLYESGRRAFGWVKFKEGEGTTGKLKDTIDAVVMGYYSGEGKRKSFGIGAFLVGVKKGESFVTVTKIGTGVSDEQWKELFERFKRLKASNTPKEYEGVAKMLVPDVWLIPEMVVEIAGDDLTKSPNHGAGYAVRFPRLVRIREDKKPEQATTTDEVSTMFQNQ